MFLRLRVQKKPPYWHPSFFCESVLKHSKDSNPKPSVDRPTPITIINGNTAFRLIKFINVLGTFFDIILLEVYLY